MVDGGLGNAFSGAVVITLGMWFPCFLFTIMGHSLLEKLVRNKVSFIYHTVSEVRHWYKMDTTDTRQLLASFFDGLCGSVVGVIAIVAAQILQSSVEGSPGNNEQGGSITATLDRVSHTGSAAVMYLLALGVLYKFTNKYTPLLLLACGAVAGQFIFV